MLVINNKPFNPNRKASAGPTWDQKDVQLTLDNLSDIPVKDITVTGKSLDYYKDVNKEETIAEIIATWNLTQYNILSGVRDVLISTDRIINITENRNKLIGQCVKKLNYFEARHDRINFLLSQAAHTIPETKINDYKTQQKVFNIWTIASCQDASFSENELNNNIFYNLDIQENINTLQMTNEINNKQIYKIDKSLGISNNLSLVSVTDIANPRHVKRKNEPQSISHKLIELKPPPNKQNIPNNKFSIKHKKLHKNNRKKKKKKYKQKVTNKINIKKQQKQHQIQQNSPRPLQKVDCSKYDDMIARTIEMDRIGAIHQAKDQAKQNKMKSSNNGDVD